MSADPFFFRCRRCGVGMLDDVEYCGRGPAHCRSDLARLGDAVAGLCRWVLAIPRKLGLLR